jgi:phage N-6-adenine-methyltransferase
VSTALIPAPGTDLVPDDWCQQVVVPWLATQTDDANMTKAEATLAGLEAAYRTIGADVFEITKARRLLEVRWGELLGAAKRGAPAKDEKVEDAPLSQAQKDQRKTFRSLAENRDRVLDALETATDAEDITRAAVLRAAKGDPHAVHYSSETPEWSTPQDLFDALHAEFKFTLDVCATKELAKCKRFFSPEQDGLGQKWSGVCWMNPPYGAEIPAWIEKASAAADDGATVVCLVPARTDTAWWWDYISFAEVRFLRGRLRFGGASAGAPFPSAVVIFGRPIKTVYWDWR